MKTKLIEYKKEFKQKQQLLKIFEQEQIQRFKYQQR